MLLIRRSGIVVAGVMGLVLSVWAADPIPVPSPSALPSPVPSVSAKPAEKPFSALTPREKFSIGYFSVLHGPSLDGKIFSVGPRGEEWERGGLNHSLSYRYRINEQLTLVTQSIFNTYYQRVLEAEFMTQRVGVAFSLPIYGDFSFSGNINTDVPGLHNQSIGGSLGNSSKNGFIASPALGGGFNYAPKDNPFNASLFIGPRYFIFTKSSPGVRQANLYFGPQFTYKLNETLKLSLASDFFWKKKQGGHYQKDPNNLMPGIEISINKYITILPYINIWVPIADNADPIAPDHMFLGMWLYGRLF